jgi:hypothetical protein
MFEKDPWKALMWHEYLGSSKRERMSQCSFFLDNLVCLDSDHTVAYPRLERSWCFRSTPGWDTHSHFNRKRQYAAYEKAGTSLIHGGGSI